MTLRVKLHHPGSVRNMFRPFHYIALAEAYVYNDIDVIGDMGAFCDLCDFIEDRFNSFTIRQKLKLGWQLWNLPKVPQLRNDAGIAQMKGTQHSLDRDRQAISFHYDISNEFFKQFLDQHMVYTSTLLPMRARPWKLHKNGDST